LEGFAIILMIRKINVSIPFLNNSNAFHSKTQKHEKFVCK